MQLQDLYEQEKAKNARLSQGRVELHQHQQQHSQESSPTFRDCRDVTISGNGNFCSTKCHCSAEEANRRAQALEQVRFFTLPCKGIT